MSLEAGSPGQVPADLILGAFFLTHGHLLPAFSHNRESMPVCNSALFLVLLSTNLLRVLSSGPQMRPTKYPHVRSWGFHHFGACSIKQPSVFCSCSLYPGGLNDDGSSNSEFPVSAVPSGPFLHLILYLDILSNLPAVTIIFCSFPLLSYITRPSHTQQITFLITE